MLPILTVSQMQQVDRETIENLGLPGAVLMETAGRAVVKALGREFPSAARRPAVLCGTGNNGGDGFVAARCLLENAEEGWPLVFLCGELAGLRGDAALMAQVAIGCGVRVLELKNTGLDELAGVLAGADLVVDGLLGSGAQGAPRGLIARIIELLEGVACPVVAIDSPSGVDMDTGQVPGPAVRADLTVTLGFEKIGHRLYPGRSFCGKVQVADIGFPRAAASKIQFSLFLSQPADIRDSLPTRAPDAHKGDCGKVLVVGGSTGLTGAPVMACQSALVCGAGLVTAAVPASLNVIFETKLTEAMTCPLEDRGTGALGPDSLEALASLIEKEVDVLALGPGIGRDPGTRELVLELAARVKVPTVLDADGLNAFENSAGALERFGGPLVVTPHPGEMARLSGRSVGEIKASPIEAARAFAESHGVVVLLKGAPSVIAQPGGKTVLNPTGGPALAKGGSGDVLTGVIAGLMAQGLEPFAAAFCGAYLHGLAGDLAAEELGVRGVLASDLIDLLPEAFQQVAQESPGGWESGPTEL